MDFDYSDEQRTIKAQVRRVLEELGDGASRREVFEGRAPFNRDLWKQAGELGWTGIAIDEAHGGLGLGHVSLCGVSEELGRALAPLPFASSIFLAAEALILAGSKDQKNEWLPTLASGACIGSLAVAEGAGRLGNPWIACHYGDGRLSGTKIAVVDGGVADIAVVAAQSDDGPGLFLARLDAPGVQREPQQSIDPCRPIVRIRFDGVPAEPLADGPGGRDVLQSLLVRAAVMTAFEQLGGAEAALERARAYALERYAFGRPIGSFQAIKHTLAEVHVAIELARSQAYFAAWALESASEDLPVAAASARLAATAAFERAARDLIQVHGGIGMTWEHDAHLFYRRSRHLALVVGDRAQWRDMLIDRLAVQSQTQG